MSDRIWIVTCELASNDDATALADLIRELGYFPDLSSRQIGKQRKISLIRETRAGKAILNFMDYGRSYHYTDVGVALEEQGYKANGAASALAKMVIEGDIDRIGDGIYQKVKKDENSDKRQEQTGSDQKDNG